MSPKKDAKKSATKQQFTAEERAAMKDRIQEQRGANDESAVVAKIAAMSEPDRSLAKRFHALVKSAAPELAPRLWYGMPAYAKDEKVVCHFQGAAKFKTRYATIGFSDKANLDDGTFWPVAFAVRQMTAAEETRISALVRKAAN